MQVKQRIPLLAGFFLSANRVHRPKAHQFIAFGAGYGLSLLSFPREMMVQHAPAAFVCIAQAFAPAV
ncbi:hypothetical protein V8Z74_13460 [Comamonas sp. w2-DMI]|uniref:hypothetical protein n=1 Tax=Comamonas sp. w2-DMI TaxID=3126391 RepID=UPI0032E39C14